MLRYEVRIERGTGLKDADRLIERLCAEEGLERTVKRTLQFYPGSMHWHFRRRIEAGTLEVILWPGKRRIWLSVHANRTGQWTDKSVRRLQQAIERELRKEMRFAKS